MLLRRAFFALCLMLTAGAAFAQQQANNVVYHISDTKTQALGGLRSIKNHLDADPSAKITVVALGDGIDFMMEGAMDRNGNPYEIAVQLLVERGVKFEICEVTLTTRDLKKDKFLQEGVFVPSGVVRIAQLQHQGYAYIRP